MGGQVGYGSELINGYRIEDLVNTQLGSSVSPEYADAVSLVRHYGLPVEHVAEQLNQSHVQLQEFTTDLYGKASQLVDVNAQLQEVNKAQQVAIAEQQQALATQDAIIQEYANHMIDHQQFVANIIPHIARYEQMEELLTDPHSLLEWYQNLAAISQEYQVPNQGQSQGQSDYQFAGYNEQGQPVYIDSQGQYFIPSGNQLGNQLGNQVESQYNDPRQLPVVGSATNGVEYVAQQLDVRHLATQAGGRVSPADVERVIAEEKYKRESPISIGLARPTIPLANPNAASPDNMDFSTIPPWEAYKTLDQLEKEGLIGVARRR